jgi:hypothetical protein
MTNELVEVKPENPCDMCGKEKAGYYSTVYYVHVCSQECIDSFISKYEEEIASLVTIRLSPMK